MVKVHTSIVTPPPLDGMLVHRRVTPQHLYTWWREAKCSKVTCLGKQRDGRGLNPGPPDPVFEVLTAQPHTPPLVVKRKLTVKDFKATSQGESFNSAWKKWMNQWLMDTISTCVFHFEKVLRSLDKKKKLLTFFQNNFFLLQMSVNRNGETEIHL